MVPNQRNLRDKDHCQSQISLPLSIELTYSFQIKDNLQKRLSQATESRLSCHCDRSSSPICSCERREIKDKPTVETVTAAGSRAKNNFSARIRLQKLKTE